MSMIKNKVMKAQIHRNHYQNHWSNLLLNLRHRYAEESSIEHMFGVDFTSIVVIWIIIN